MRADNSHHLTASAGRRRDETRHRAEAALRSVEQSCEAMTLTQFAVTAGVSRAWLYQQPGLRERLRRLQVTGPAGAPAAATVPPAQRASADSLRKRLELAHARIRQLTEETSQLRHELAQAHGLLRATRQASPHPTPASPGERCCDSYVVDVPPAT